MPRRNSNSARASQKRNGRRRPGAGRPLIDWDRIEKIDRGDQPEFTSYPPRRKEVVTNVFTRHLTGFGDEALEILGSGRFKNFDTENGCLPVTFSGISQLPLKSFEYKKPTLARTPGGLLVISGLVGGKAIKEVGGGYTPISQVDAPDLDTHSSHKRLNVALGPEPANFDENELAKHLRVGENTLTISKVASINDKTVESYHGPWDIDPMWNRAKEPSRYDPYGRGW